jgi:hypothetical protein
MRRMIGIFAVIAATMTALVVGGLGVIGAGAQTNHGTVKIFDGDKELPANDPKVCGPFTVQGLNFDAVEQVTVDIVGHGGPNAGPGTFHGVFTTNQSGAFSSSPITLPEGMYKLDSEDGEGGGDKNKVFKVECPPEVPPTQPPETKPPETKPPETKPPETKPPETKSVPPPPSGPAAAPKAPPGPGAAPQAPRGPVSVPSAAPAGAVTGVPRVTG